MSRFTQRIGLSRYEADEHYQMALEADRKGRFDPAINHMTDAIALLPSRAEYYAARGFFYLEDDVPDNALADFEQALKLNPGEMLAHYGRGMIAYKSNNLEEAQAHFADAYRADPNRPETLYYLALIYHRKKDSAVARRLMEVALERFDPVDTRHRADAQRWIKEFDRILAAKKP
ncbi:MAG: tetratricopeptide repeat protein [Anaerolineae bacterium]|nr:tetratricopeptide repeat protein [Anaerolineae bacterium]